MRYIWGGNLRLRHLSAILTGPPRHRLAGHLKVDLESARNGACCLGCGSGGGPSPKPTTPRDKEDPCDFPIPPMGDSTTTSLIVEEWMLLRQPAESLAETIAPGNCDVVGGVELLRWMVECGESSQCMAGAAPNVVSVKYGDGPTFESNGTAPAAADTMDLKMGKWGMGEVEFCEKGVCEVSQRVQGGGAKWGGASRVEPEKRE